MLKQAILYKDEIEKAFLEIAFDDNYKFLDSCNYRQKKEIFDTSIEFHQYACVDKNNKLIGFLQYKADRWIDSACGLVAVNFIKDVNSSLVFAKDLKQLFDDIFYKFNFNKLNWTVIVGNPVEKSYDKLVKKIGGRIIGTYKNDVKLIDNKFYDLKAYEVLREEFIKARNPKAR